MSSLDLPVAEQTRIAKEIFGMDLEEWQEMTKKDLAEIQAFEEKLVIANPVFTDDYTKEDHERFAKRMASCDAGIRSGSI